MTDEKIEENTEFIKRQFEVALKSIENLNVVFNREAMKLEGFKGMFYDSFLEEVKTEKNLTEKSNQDNLDRVRLLLENYNHLLYESSHQEYYYETELIPNYKESSSCSRFSK